MSLQFTIPAGLRSEIDYWFAEGGSLRSISDDIDLQRRWRVLHQRDDLALFACSSGGIVQLEMRGGRIAGTEVKIGQDARALHIRYGLKPSESIRTLARNVLTRGRPVDEALSRLPSHEVSNIETGPNTRRRLHWLPWHGTLSIREHNGEIANYSWLTGAAALRAFEQPPRAGN